VGGGNKLAKQLRLEVAVRKNIDKGDRFKGLNNSESNYCNNTL
jgi:hypothetical protein